LRPKTLRAAATSGVLLGSTTLALAPAVASSDPAPATPAPAAPTAIAAAKAPASLTVRSVRRDVLAGRNVLVRGSLRPAAAGRSVALQVARARGGWITVDYDRTDQAGRYVLRWRALKTGSRRVRVHFGGTRDLASARRSLGTARVYRRAFASWYGPGLYGSHLACGGRLSAGTLGVAHKSLPCGTKVTLHYRGRTVRVPVVDRGPYVGGREFDLTAATRQRLRFGSTGTVLTTR
jgi:rare lipoprotein A